MVSKSLVILKKQLAQTLDHIKQYDTDYEARYGLVLQALHLAYEVGFEAGIRIDKNEPEWPVVYIELPTGQVSWHMPQHKNEWDEHTTIQKYNRILSWAKQLDD